MRCSRRGVLLAVVASALSLFIDHGQCRAVPPDPPPVLLTSRAWEFTDLDGALHTIDRRAWNEGALIVFFFDPQSPNSLLGLNFFDALFKRAGDFGLSMIGVEATGRPAGEVRALLQRYVSVYKTPSFPVTADHAFATAELFGNHRAPTTLLFGERGQILARQAVFDFDSAVEITRLVERLLHRSEGDFSPALRDVGLSEFEENQMSVRTNAFDGDDQARKKALIRGDRLPPFEFTDCTGRSGRWAWPGRAAIRVAFFWNGSSADAVDAFSFFQELYTRRGGGEYFEIIAVESTRLSADLVNSTLKDFQRTLPALSFSVVPDPQARLVGLFGAGEPLPQTFLIGGEGEVLYRADGFDRRIQRVLGNKVGLAVRLAGFGLPQPGQEESLGDALGAEGTEAPSINRRREEDEALRINLSQGDYFFSNGQFERAELFYQRYLALEPGYLHALVRLAQIYDRTREPAKARETWERVLRISPDHAEARSRLIQLRQINLQ